MSQRIKRLAIVIGNSEYENLANLANATNDAKAVQEMLRSLEFEVTYGINLLRNEILSFFSNILDSWEYKPEEIVFYYSGRAISYNDKIYLAPFDADINLPETFTKSFLDMDIIINTLLKKRKRNAVPIIIILNCYHSLLKSDNVDGYYKEHPLRKISKEIGKNPNIAILYSMTEDEIRLDGDFENELSPYTQALLENMEKDWTISRIHGVILKSLADSGKLHDKKVPWIYQSLYEPYKFCLPKIIPHDHVTDPFHGVPRMNQNFIDRSGIFTKMHSIFTEKSRLGGRTILALQGLGGTGKTQIMLQYCYIHRLEYDFIFWLETDGRNLALESFHKLAINLGLDIDIANEKLADNSIIEWVSAWLEKRTKWLLLLNNANEEIIKDIFDVLPRFGGDIIISTREQINLTRAKIVTVSKMEENEALSLLYGATAISAVNQQSTQHQYAKEIVSELDFLPLAIDLARAYTDTMMISFNEYLKMLRNQRDRVEVFSHRDEDNIHQYNHSLATVWKISLERIKIESPMAATILNICSFFHPELIPVSFFENEPDSSLSSNLEEREDSWRIVREAIGVLVKFSFVSLTLSEDINGEKDPASNVLTIHRLVQRVVYDAIDEEQRILYTNSIASALIDELDFSDSYSSRTRTMMNAYILHIRHFSRMLDINQLVFMSEDLFELMIQTTLYLLNNGIYFGAEEFAKLTMSISVSIHEPESYSITRSLVCQADLHMYQGNFAEAKPLYEQALAIREIVLGAGHLETARSMNSLALLYFYQGSYPEARTLYEQALMIFEKELGFDNTDRASSMNNLALLYENQGNYAKAKQLYKDALEVFEKTLGPEHPSTAASLHNMAHIYSIQGDFANAKLLFEQVLEISEKVLGPEHPTMVSSLNNLASLYSRQRNYTKAEPLLERALVISEKSLGSEHPETAVLLNNLAFLYEKRGDYDKVEPLYKRALMISEKALGLEHSETATSLINLARLYGSQGNYAEAKVLYERALAIKETALGHMHPETAICLSCLASLYISQGNYIEAKSLYERALVISEETFGSEHPETAEYLSGLALIYHFQGDNAKASSLYERVMMIEKALELGDSKPVFDNSLPIFYKNQGYYSQAKPLYERMLAFNEKMFGPNSPDVATVLNNLAVLYRDQGDYTKAEPLHERALMISETTLGPDHPLTSVTLNNLGLLCSRQGDYAKADLLFKRALEIREKVLGPDVPYTATSLIHLATLYQNQGDYAKAEPLFERALAINERVLGPENPDTAISINNLAFLYFHQKNYTKAEPLYKRALSILEKTSGLENPDTAKSLSNLAVLYKNQGEYSKAEAIYERVLAISEKVLGEDPFTAISLHNLAGIYKIQGDHAKTGPLYERAVVISEKVFGPMHPETATCLHSLASYYKIQEDFLKAETLYKRALMIRERELGHEHPNTATSLNDLAKLYQIQGNHAKAEPLYKRALMICEAALGSEHPNTVKIRSNLTLFYEDQNKRLKGGKTTSSWKNNIKFPISFKKRNSKS